jgi:hypothetical protein
MASTHLIIASGCALANIVISCVQAETEAQQIRIMNVKIAAGVQTRCGECHQHHVTMTTIADELRKEFSKLSTTRLRRRG